MKKFLQIYVVVVLVLTLVFSVLAVKSSNPEMAGRNNCPTVGWNTSPMVGWNTSPMACGNPHLELAGNIGPDFFKNPITITPMVGWNTRF